MQVTRSLQNNMSIKWARPAEESICCSLKLFLHMHNLELQFLEKKIPLPRLDQQLVSWNLLFLTY